MPLIFFAGALAGSLHVLTGPDHLAAVAPYAVRRRWRPWVPGALWGAGHVVGVGLIGLLAWTIREVLPLEAISAHSETFVGLVLIAIGLWTLRCALRQRLHAHTHTHDGERHTHIHIHTHAPHAPEEPATAAQRHDHSHAPFWVGGLHGLAGSAHLLGVLPALAFPTQAGTVTYLAGYAGGTVGAMVVFSMLLGWATQRVGRMHPGAHAVVTGAAGVLAIFVGAIWLLSSR